MNTVREANIMVKIFCQLTQNHYFISVFLPEAEIACYNDIIVNMARQVVRYSPLFSLLLKK